MKGTRWHVEVHLPVLRSRSSCGGLDLSPWERASGGDHRVSTNYCYVSRKVRFLPPVGGGEKGLMSNSRWGRKDGGFKPCIRKYNEIKEEGYDVLGGIGMVEVRRQKRRGREQVPFVLRQM